MMSRIIFVYFACILSVAFAVSKDFCLNGNLMFHHCICELTSPNDLMPSKSLYGATEAKLSCTGVGSVKSANEVLQLSQNEVVFTELHISLAQSENINQNNLKGFSSLKTLVLTKNNISSIDPSFLKSFPKLEKLDLSQNKISSIPKDAFQYVSNLKKLSFSSNEISSVEETVFHPLEELQSVDFSSNSIYFVNPKWFSTNQKLLTLNLSSNEIFTIEPEVFQHLHMLQELDLSQNKLEQLSQHMFFRLKGLRHLSLAMNNLQTLNENAFKGNRMLEQVNLTGNIWMCDRNLLPLSDWLRIHEIDKSYCAEPMDFRNSTVQNALHILYLEMKLEESVICNASMCNCTVSRDKQVVTVDCTGRGFTKLPESLPYKTRVLDLRNNNIRSLTTDHVNATQWADVSFLLLNNNEIASLKGLEGTSLLRTLVALHLKNNQLTEIPIHILEQFRGGLLDELYLSGNPWNCDCNTVRFQTWLQDNFKTVKDFDGIRCAPLSGIYSNQPIYQLLKSQLCPQDEQLINYLDILNGLMACAIIVIVVKLSYDFWLQKRTGKLPRFFSLNL